MKWGVRTLVALVAAGLLYVFVWGLSSNRDPSAVPSPLVCKPAPGFRLTGLTDPAVSLDPKAKGYKLVNFWASWCPTCAQEHPRLVALRDNPPVKDFQLIQVLTLDEDLAAAKRIEKTRGKVVPTGIDADGTVATGYGVRATPESFVISPKGLILQKFEGAITYEVVAKVIEEDQHGHLCKAGGS